MNRSTKLKVLSIYSEVNRQVVLEKLKAGKITGCGPSVPTLTTKDIEATPTIVGQMGPEPYVQAMAAHPDFDIIIGGRAYDPAPYIAFCAFQAFAQSDKPVLSLPSDILGGFSHMGKIMECGGACATPKCKGSMATVYRDGTFDIQPLAPGAVCTPTSVAAHTMYEKTRPDHLHGPGGYIDLCNARYVSLSDNLSVRAQGAIFKTSKELGNSYTVKLEGAKVIGYRTIFMGSFADPILISQLSFVLEQAKKYVAQQHKLVQEEWSLDFHVYGQHDQAESNSTGTFPSAPHEVFIVGEAVAKTQAAANAIAATARVACVHGPYKGQKANAGNFGMGIGGRLSMEMGACAEFSLYHLMEIDEGSEEACEINTEGSGAAGEEFKNPQRYFKWDMSWLGTGERIQRNGLTTRTLDQNYVPISMPIPPLRSDINGSTSPFPCTLGEVASIIRTKNAGPYEITMDVIFNNDVVYQQIKKSGILHPKLIADLYNIAENDIIYCGFFDQAMGFKATLPRLRNGKIAPCGGYMEDDVHGSQRHIPLFGVKLNI